MGYAHMSMEGLLRYVDGELSFVEAARVKHHLSACWECRAKLRQSEATIAQLIELHHQTLDPQLPPVNGPRALLKARLVEMERNSRRDDHPKRVRWPQVAFAGALLILIVAGVLTGEHLEGVRRSAQSGSGLVSYAKPNRRLTPGAARVVSVNELCTKRYNDDASLVPAEMREKVLAEYGVTGPHARDYELDYLISPQLGGSDDISNLWPEPESSTVWNMTAKDALEDRLHVLVCQGQVSLPLAQEDLAVDWIAAYKKYFHATQPLQP